MSPGGRQRGAALAHASVSTLRVGDEELWVLALPEPPETATASLGLTPSEQQIAELAAAGLSNAEIAERRSTSLRTVANQLASVYKKLGIGSRAELGLTPIRPARKAR